MRPNGTLCDDSFQLMVHQTTAEMYAKFIGVLRRHYAEFAKASEGKPEDGVVPQRDFYGNIFQTVLGFKPNTVYGVFHGRVTHGLGGNCACDSWLEDVTGKRKCAGELIEHVLGCYCTTMLGSGFRFRTWRFVTEPKGGWIPNIWCVGEQKLLALAS